MIRKGFNEEISHSKGSSGKRYYYYCDFLARTTWAIKDVICDPVDSAVPGKETSQRPPLLLEYNQYKRRPTRPTIKVARDPFN